MKSKQCARIFELLNMNDKGYMLDCERNDYISQQLKKLLSDNKPKKHVFIVNGPGGSGKDYLINKYIDHHKNGMNISIIHPFTKYIFDVCENSDKINKDLKFRTLINNIKKSFDKYAPVGLEYITKEFKKFLNSESDILFVHIGDIKDIVIFSDTICELCNVHTLYIIRDDDCHFSIEEEDPRFGEISPFRIGVSNYRQLYDCMFINTFGSGVIKEKSIKSFINFIDKIISD